jgi:hypothetical protein
VQREQRCHRSERGADEDGARVVEARADDRQRDGRGGRRERRDADRVEVGARVQLDRMPAHGCDQGRGRERDDEPDREHGKEPLPHRDAHMPLFRPRRPKAE